MRVTIKQIHDYVDSMQNMDGVDKNTKTKFAMMHHAASIIGTTGIDQLVLKGGFVVSNIIGGATRTTADIDYSLFIYIDESVIKQKMIQVLTEGFEKDFRVEIIKFSDVDKYVKFKIRLTHIPSRSAISIDVSNSPERYLELYSFSLKTLDIPLKAIRPEAIIAEKIVITVNKMPNPRMHDIFDIGMLYKPGMASDIAKVIPLVLESRQNGLDTKSTIHKFKEIILDIPDSSSTKRYANMTLKDVRKNIINCIEDISNI